MNQNISENNIETGSITVIALMVLVTLTLLGMMAMNTTNIDILISGNLRRFKENFYVSVGGDNYEEAEIGAGQYPVVDIDSSGLIVGRDDALRLNSVAMDIDENGTVVADNAFDHNLPSGDYEFVITYNGYFPPPSGYSPIQFSSYHYTIESYSDPGGSDLFVGSRCFKIGPKT